MKKERRKMNCSWRRFVLPVCVVLMAFCISSCGKTAQTAETAGTAATNTSESTASLAESSVAETKQQNTQEQTVQQQATAATSEAATTEIMAATTADAAKDSASSDVFRDMDGIIFGFMSGVGAWETLLKVKADGSFEGEFYDVNMGESSNMYENGTVYECFFTGKFAEPSVKDTHTLLSKVEELKWEEKVNYVKEDMLHVSALPYGLNQGDEVTIYLPGSKVADFSEEFLSWAQLALPKEAVETKEILLKVGADEYCFFPDHYAMGDAKTFYSTEEWDSDYVKAMKKAYTDQKMPDKDLIPAVYSPQPPAKPYESVTLDNLQGSWVNVYNENGTPITEILTVNGNHGKMVTRKNGELYGVWNGEGTCSIEDRSDQGKCPAFRIDMEDGSNLCTIYIRWVNANEFYDGGFLNSWYFMNEDEPDHWLQDTVTLEKLEGVWYSEQTGSKGFRQTILIMKDGEATLFETLDGVPVKERNGKGKASVALKHDYPYEHIPELVIDFKEGESKGNTAGIYISVVDENRFYDAENRKYFVKVY